MIQKFHSSSVPQEAAVPGHQKTYANVHRRIVCDTIKVEMRFYSRMDAHLRSIHTMGKRLCSRENSLELYARVCMDLRNTVSSLGLFPQHCAAMFLALRPYDPPDAKCILGTSRDVACKPRQGVNLWAHGWVLGKCLKLLCDSSPC